MLGIYEKCRYNWILDNIKVLIKPIKAKEKLGLWEYKKQMLTKKG